MRGTISDQDEDAQTFMAHFTQYQCNHVMETKATLNYLSMLVNTSLSMCIIDGGADSYVGGKVWLPLSPISGPLVKRANVTGFDSQTTKKNGLPIISGVVKTKVDGNRTIFLRAQHLIYNSTSEHTLLSSFQLREAGFIVDDVSERHKVNQTSQGTHSIIFPDEETQIKLVTRGALSTFEVSKPTMEEYLNAKEEDIYDISVTNWDPQDYYDNVDSTANNTQMNEWNEVEELANIIETFDEEPDSTEMDDQQDEEHTEKTTINTKSSFPVSKMLKACMSIAAIGSTNALNMFNLNKSRKLSTREIHSLYSPIKNRVSKVMQLTIDYQTIGHGVKGSQDQVKYISTNKVDELLDDLDYFQLTGHNEIYNTVTCAVQTSKTMQSKPTSMEQTLQAEAIRPRLAWKPIEVIKRTLENTTQWGK